MDRAEFLAEVDRRGYRRELILLYPGVDEQRNPEGGIVIAAPTTAAGGRWRTYRMDRGVQDETRFDSESEAYEHVLTTFLTRGRSRRSEALGREQFLDEIERRGGKRSWFLFYPGPDEAKPTEGRVIVEHRDESGEQPWRVYRQDRGIRDVETFDTESAALRYLLDATAGPR